MFGVGAAYAERRCGLQGGQLEIRTGRAVISPRLHILMHEVVANQRWADAPSGVSAIARRLRGDDFEVLCDAQSHGIETVGQALAVRATRRAPSGCTSTPQVAADGR